MHAVKNDIIFFDGVCNLCNGFVDFVIRRDPRGRFRFASLQSTEAAKLIPPRELRLEVPDSIVLVTKDAVYHRSGAVLRILGGLRFPWPVFLVFWIVPAPVRDAVYGWVAANRYRWFGKRESCRVPTAQERERFEVEG